MLGRRGEQRPQHGALRLHTPHDRRRVFESTGENVENRRGTGALARAITLRDPAGERSAHSLGETRRQRGVTGHECNRRQSRMRWREALDTEVDQHRRPRCVPQASDSRVRPHRAGPIRFDPDLVPGHAAVGPGPVDRPVNSDAKSFDLSLDRRHPIHGSDRQSELCRHVGEQAFVVSSDPSRPKQHPNRQRNHDDDEGR